MKISVLTTTYNRLGLSRVYLPKILDRAGANVEFLLWDNGSNDGSADWVYEFGEANANVAKVFLSDKNIGMEAFNEMAKEASGEYLIKIDDDILPPENFANRLVKAYEEIGEERLAFLSWDMPWGKTPASGGDTFATRSGMLPYEDSKGKIIELSSGTVYIAFCPGNWLVNGACRMCRRDIFLELGGHPKGIIYGVDYHVSLAAENQGYWIGYFSPSDLIEHCGNNDTPEYRKFKDEELRRVKSPRDV